MPWVGLQCVIVAFPGHTHLIFCTQIQLTVNKEDLKCHLLDIVNQLIYMYYLVKIKVDLWPVS